MKIEQVAIEDLTEDPRNARSHPERNMKAIVASLDRFAQVEPLVVRQGSNIVIGGNGRLAAMRSLGWGTCDVVYVDVDDATASAMGLALNRTAELAEWNPDQLSALLQDFSGDEFLDGFDGLMPDLMQFDPKETAALIEVSGYSRRPLIEDEAPEPPKDPVTKLGDVWELGRHRVVCGDCRDVVDGMEWGSVVADPPYGMRFQSNMRKDKHEKIIGDGDDELLLFACDLKSAHSKYIWCRWDNLCRVPQPKSVITWVKNSWSMGDLQHEHARMTESCLFYPGPAHCWMSDRPGDVVRDNRTGNDLHPTQKPVDLMATVIGWTDGRVLDPFLGSGTTLIAAEQLDRVCYGVEISPAYCDVIVERWQNLTGGKARRTT